MQRRSAEALAPEGAGSVIELPIRPGRRWLRTKEKERAAVGRRGRRLWLPALGAGNAREREQKRGSEADLRRDLGRTRVEHRRLQIIAYSQSKKLQTPDRNMSASARPVNIVGIAHICRLGALSPLPVGARRRRISVRSRWACVFLRTPSVLPSHPRSSRQARFGFPYRQ